MLKRLLLSTALVLGVASSAAADYTAGLAAYANDDFATAYSEFNVSARAGHRDSQYMLGRLHELGRGVRQDFVQAHLWYNLAAAQGQSRAAAARDALAARMTATQLAQAQQLAAAAQPGLVPTAPSTPAVATYSVRDIQRLLNQLGYNAGTVDGVMGARTREAIRAFQRRQGMAVTGQPSVLLYNRLQAAVSSGATIPAATPPTQPVVPATNDLVADVQAALRQRGYDIPVVSGVLDARTQTAIRTYQADVGLPATGQVSQSLLTSLRVGVGSQQNMQTALQQRDLVRQIQTELNRRGYDAGPADGALGPKTRAAIRTYQADAGLQVTGQASPSLLANLQTGTQTASPAQPTTPSQPVSQTDPTRQMVLAIEDELRVRGYNPGAVDGVYDAQLAAAVRAFQTDAGLTLTGQPSQDLLAFLRTSNVVARRVPQTPEDVASQLLQGVTNEIFGRIQQGQ